MSRISRLVQSQLKLVEQLHEQARMELNKQIHERTQENTDSTNHILELTTKLVGEIFRLGKLSFCLQTTAENEMKQLQMINTNAQSKIIELTEEIVE